MEFIDSKSTKIPTESGHKAEPIYSRQRLEYIDTHIHLTLEDYGTDLPHVLKRAYKAGVRHCVVPGLDSASSRKSIDLAQQYKEIIPAVGLHPLSAQENYETFRELAALPIVTAIGEVGTDSKAGDWADQEERFRFFLDLAVETAKPLLIHIRDTWDPTLKVLAEYPELEGKAVIHCFTGGEKEAEMVAKLGLLLSFTAIIARPGMKQTHNVIKEWPLDQMMLETDGPWLSWPGEDWPNEPKTVVKIAEYIAQLRSISTEEVAKKTTQAVQHFFNLHSR